MPGLYDRTGAPVRLYRAGGTAASLYDRSGNRITGAAGGTGGGTTPVSYGQAANEHPDRMGQWWSQLAASGTTKAVALEAGNSLSAGYIASTAGTVDHVQFRANGYVFKTRTDALAAFGDDGEGLITLTDPRVTFGGSPVNRNTWGPGEAAYELSAGQSVTYTGVTGTRVALVRRWVTGGSAAPSVTIDGVAQTVAATGTTDGQTITDTFTTTAGTHTVVVTGPASLSAVVMCLVTHNNLGRGVSLHRVSAPGGYIYSSFLSSVHDGISAAAESNLWKVTLADLNVNLLVLAFGHNEMTFFADHGVTLTPAVYSARLKRVLDYQINTRGQSACLISGPAVGSDTSPYVPDDFWTVQRDLAASYPARCEYFDFRTRMSGTWSSTDYWDGKHPKIATHDTMRAIARDSLFPTGAALSGRIALTG